MKSAIENGLERRKEKEDHMRGLTSGHHEKASERNRREKEIIAMKGVLNPCDSHFLSFLIGKRFRRALGLVESLFRIGDPRFQA